MLYNTIFRYSSERELQDQIEARVLKQHGIPYEREVTLSPKDRIDFLTEAAGIEVKIDGPASAVLRQLFRYAKIDRVQTLILVTSRTSHRDMPDEILGKPLFIVHLLHSIF